MRLLTNHRGLPALTIAALVLAGVVYARGLSLLQFTPPADIPAEFTALGWGSGVPTLLGTVAAASPVVVLLFGLLVVLLAAAGAAWAGMRAQILTGLAALFCVPLLLNTLAAPARGVLLAVWCGLLLWSARAAAASRGAALAGGMLAGIMAGAHLFFVLPLVWLAVRQPRGRRAWFGVAGVAAALVTLLLLPALISGLRADVADLLPARDLQRQAWRLQNVAPDMVPAYALGQWWRTISANPLHELLARWGTNALRLVAPAEGEDTYPWTVVRTYDWPLRLLPAWSIFIVLGALGGRAITAEQRWQLLPYILTPVLAGVFIGPALWWRALLAAPLCYLAARGTMLLWAQPARAMAGATALAAMLLVHWLPPDYTPAALWRGLTIVAVHQAEPGQALRYAQAWATRYPVDDEAWWLAHYAAFHAGQGALAQQYLSRALIFAPNDYRRESYAAGLVRLKSELVRRAAQQRAPE